jgi:hypothetical protein
MSGALGAAARGLKGKADAADANCSLNVGRALPKARCGARLQARALARNASRALL